MHHRNLLLIVLLITLAAAALVPSATAEESALYVKKVENLTETIDFDNIDFILINPGELKVVLEVIKTLEKQKKQLVKYIDANKIIVAVGTSGAIFSKEIKTLDNTKHKGLGILDMTCSERKMVIGDDLYFTINQSQEIMASQIQMLDFELHDVKKLGAINYGYGNNGTEAEGARHKNLIFTNALGPIFVKNPWWTEKVLCDIADRKGYMTSPVPIEEYELEIKSYNSTKEFIKKKIGK